MLSGKVARLLTKLKHAVGEPADGWVGILEHIAEIVPKNLVLAIFNLFQSLFEGRGFELASEVPGDHASLDIGHREDDVLLHADVGDVRVSRQENRLVELVVQKMALHVIHCDITVHKREAALKTGRKNDVIDVTNDRTIGQVDLFAPAHAVVRFNRHDLLQTSMEGHVFGPALVHKPRLPRTHVDVLGSEFSRHLTNIFS